MRNELGVTDEAGEREPVDKDIVGVRDSVLECELTRYWGRVPTRPGKPEKPRKLDHDQEIFLKLEYGLWAGALGNYDPLHIESGRIDICTAYYFCLSS